jgi:hypothetical protein
MFVAPHELVRVANFVESEGSSSVGAGFSEVSTAAENAS